MGKKQETSCIKSFASRSSMSTSITKIQHEVNSSKSPEFPPWGSVSTVTAKISKIQHEVNSSKSPEFPPWGLYQL